MADPILIAKDNEDIYLLPKMSNRHGLIAGATGTGKSVTLRVMAESFSKLGIPVFMADVKGDLAGICQAGGDNPKVAERAQQWMSTLAGAYAPMGSDANLAAMKKLMGFVRREALVMAMADVFLLIAFIFAIMLVFIPFVKRPPNLGIGGDSH